MFVSVIALPFDALQSALSESFKLLVSQSTQQQSINHKSFRNPVREVNLHLRIPSRHDNQTKLFKSEDITTVGRILGTFLEQSVLNLEPGPPKYLLGEVKV